MILLPAKMSGWFQPLDVDFFNALKAAYHRQNAPKVTGGVFKPIILSTGGLASKCTADEWKDWREAMPAGGFERMEKRIGVELVKARARTLVL